MLDCLSLWVSNAIEAKLSDERILDEAREIASALAKREAPAVVVSNEVGLGIVPMNALARRYRDTLGRVERDVRRARQNGRISSSRGRRSPSRT